MIPFELPKYRKINLNYLQGFLHSISALNGGVSCGPCYDAYTISKENNPKEDLVKFFNREYEVESFYLGDLSVVEKVEFTKIINDWFFGQEYSPRENPHTPNFGWVIEQLLECIQEVIEFHTVYSTSVTLNTCGDCLIFESQEQLLYLHLGVDS
jgi:hypothetical protein